MSYLQFFEGKKEYDHSESKKLLSEVREFFQRKLKIIVPEWISEKKEIQECCNDSVIQMFYIEKINDPIYIACNGYDNINAILDLFDERLNTLLDSFDSLIDNNADLDEESKNSIESYASAVDKCINVYGAQRKKRMSKFKELSTVDEIRNEIRQLLSEIVSNYIITALFDGLYERAKNNSGRIYEMVIKEINEFLSDNGIYTMKVDVGEKIDPEYMEPTQDSVNNITMDFNMFDTIDEIYRYPYLFCDEEKIIDGRARIWRRKD